jgi:hypothetical protein
LHFFTDNIVAKINAFIANEHGRTRNQLANFVLALATERAVQQLAVVAAAVLGVITHGNSTLLMQRRKKSRLR